MRSTAARRSTRTLRVSDYPVTQADLDFCYLTTIGRKTGRRRTIEIWFGLDGDTVYLLSGGGDSAQWVRNLQAEDKVTIRLGRKTYPGTARLITDKSEDARAAAAARGQIRGVGARAPPQLLGPNLAAGRR